jgi:hypothetical protein
MRAFWDLAPCYLVGVDRCLHNRVTILIIVLMMEAVRTSETSAYSETTRRYIREGFLLHNFYRVNLKSAGLLYISSALGPTQPQWVLGVLSPGLKCGRGVTLTSHPHLVPRSRMRGE